ncbi:MAG: transcriptional regulator, PadR-like family [Oscillospiraceae bacterium]|nr:transcriptional regulator, PadR-like family [Oscillospiraceae bacterium]
MSITSDTLRGHTDAIILTRLLAGDSYGYAINKGVQECTGGAHSFKEATLYTAFRRLEENGLIRSYWGDEGSGARRRYYAITAEGRQACRQHVEEWESTKHLLDAMLSDA